MTVEVVEPENELNSFIINLYGSGDLFRVS